MTLDLPELGGAAVACDTETNGLYADDGARISAVSIAWVNPDLLRYGSHDDLVTAVNTGVGFEGRAYPFSQGIWQGPDYGAKPGTQADLFSDNPNYGLDEWDQLIGWLSQRRLVFHNAKFDLEKLRYAPIGFPLSGWGGGVDLVDNTIWDTQVVAPELWPRERSGLKPTAARLWGVDQTAEATALKPHLGKQTDPRFDLAPWDILRPYAIQDALLTLRLYYLQIGILGLISRDSAGVFAAVDERQLAVCEKQIAIMKNLYRMERAGIPYPAGESLKAAAVLDRRRSQIARELPFKPTAAEAKRFFYSTGTIVNLVGKRTTGLGLTPHQTTAKGAPSLTAEVVERIAIEAPAKSRERAVARLWTEHNKLATASRMWYIPYAKGIGTDGRLRTCFRQVARGRGDEDGGTRSGRFSVERVNLQAIPHDYRLVAGESRSWDVPTPRQLIGLQLKAIPGWAGWEFDLAQAELRVATAWAQSERMLEGFAAGSDLHGETAREMFKAKPTDSDWDFYRQVGKRANFTLCFGAGWDTFARFIAKETGVRFGEQEATRMVRTWNSIYPEFGRAIAIWSQYAEAHREVPLASIRGFGTGRVRRFDPTEDTHKAFNQIVQASLGEFARDWNLRTEAICQDAGLGFEPGVGWTGLLLVIHDSQVLLLPDNDRGADIADRVVAGAADLWSGFFGTPDPRGRVAAIAGYAEGKRW